MQDSDPWRPFLDAAKSPIKAATEWKQKTGGKIIGHLLPDVPVEIIHAAGALPATIDSSGIRISMAQTYIPGYTCSHAMGAFERCLRGELSFLDGMIIPYVCDTTRNLFHIWSQHFPNMNSEFLRLPKRLDLQASRSYLIEEFSRIFEWACAIVGVPESRDRLANSVALFDKSRAAMLNAYRMQVCCPEEWTQCRVHALFTSSFTLPVEEHLKLMDDLPWDATENDTRERLPIYVRGKLWNPDGMLELLDSIGLLTVKDEILNGFRHISSQESVFSDPLEHLAELHFNRIPYVGYHFEPTDMVKRFVDRVTESKAKGVIFLNPKFCEAAGFDTPDYQEALKSKGIPSLVLETSEMGASKEQIMVRLEAFKEMLSGDFT